MIEIGNRIKQIARKKYPGVTEVVKRNKLVKELTANQEDIETALNDQFIEEKMDTILDMNKQFSKDKE